MATNIRHKRSSVAGKKPIVSQLQSGELAINTADGKVFLLRDDNTVQDLTQRIFENNSEIVVEDSGDSSGSITVIVDGNEKFKFTPSDIQIKDSAVLEDASSLTFKELDASGSDGISIKAPNALDGSYSLQLPPSLGNTDGILRLGAAGALYFSDSDIYGGNVIYVSAEKGSDSNDGINAPVRTVKKACQIASGLVYDADGIPNGTRVNIKVAVGDYTEQNPLIVPDNTVIKGDGLRGCIIRPNNANEDMLRVRNAAYFAEFTFRDKVDANYVPVATWNYAVSFDDPTDVTVDRTGYTNLPDTRPIITASPYVQNCSIISFLGGSGAKIDGTLVQSPNVPLIQIEAENPVIGPAPEQGKSMVANAFTMLSFGGTGWRLTNDAYAQIVSCFQIFLLNGVYCQSGGYCSITNSATNFGLYALRSSGYSPKTFAFDRSYVVGSGVSGGQQTLTIVGINRDEPVNEFIIRFREAEYKVAYDLMQSEKNNIVDDTLDWMDLQIAGAAPGSIWYSYTYSRSSFRDTLLVVVDSVAKDTWSTGNALTRQTALNFYSDRLADSSFLTISGQEEQTIAAFEQASVYTAGVIADLDSTVRAFVDSKFDLIKDAISDPDSIPDAVDVTSEGDVTNSFKNNASELNFIPSSVLNINTGVFTITSHGYNNLQKVVYNSNGNALVGGLDNEQTYYINVINENEFRLTYDESGDYRVSYFQNSSGTHKFLSGITEFYVDDILESHQEYQRLILESGAETYHFVPGRAITAATGASNNAAFVYSWKPADRELVISVELVSVGTTTQRNLFTTSTIIASDHSDTPNTSITINEVSGVTNLGTATFTISGTVTGSELINLENLPEKQCWFHRPSVVNSSAHTWEYAGSGIDYNALPQNGGNTRVQYEQYEELPGRVYSSGTNELGDFKVGDFITAYNRTGNITFQNKVTVDELEVLRLSLSDIVVEEISASVQLGDDELGGSKNSRIPTQLAVRQFLSNRLGFFIDKSVSTAAVPGAIVQLNTNGQLNPELIPATRQFTSTVTEGYQSRLLQIEEIPAVDLKAGDITTEQYEQIEMDLSGGLTGSDGDLITQPATGASGYLKGEYSSDTTIIVASIGAEFDTSFNTVNNLFVNGSDASVNPTVVPAATSTEVNFYLRSSNSSQYLVLSNDDDYTFTFDTITNVARSSNVATITTSSAHNLVAGVHVKVDCTSNDEFDVNGEVLSTPTTTTFTIANTGSDVSTTAGTGTVRTTMTSADGNAQGAVTDYRAGVLTNVDNANITGGSGYTPTTGTLVYEMVPLTNVSGSGSGAYADITVTAGQITDVDLRRGGEGYDIGDVLSVNAANVGGTGSGFDIEVLSIEKRAYVNILGGETFVASASSIDFSEDNTAPSSATTITLTNTISNNFLSNDVGSGGAVNYTTYRITISSHGLTNGDPVTYSNLGNVSIGGLINGDVYYAKVIDSSTIELYEDYSLLNIVEFTSTPPSNNNHNITRYTVNIVDNSIIVPAHGLTTGDAIKIEGSSLFEISGEAVVSGERFFIGSVTTNSFTLHELRSEALVSINGLVTGAKDITTTGSSTAIVTPQNVKVIAVVNTSSSTLANWNSLAVTNIDASNIISGTVSPTRLANSGTANSETFLRGDSSYQTVVQSIAKATTTDNPITLTGSNLSGEYYGDPVRIGIDNVDYAPLETYSTLGVSRFLQSQFDVDTDGTGQVFIKDGVIDAGTLDSYDSSYFLNPSNLTSAVPVNKGGTGLSVYAVGDIIYASTTGTLSTIALGPTGSILQSNGSEPEWGYDLVIPGNFDVLSGVIETSSTGTGQLFPSNATSLELGNNAENVKIGKSTASRDISSVIASYNATSSTTVTVNLSGVADTTTANVANGTTTVYLNDTSDIVYGMLVTGNGALQANTTVAGITDEFILLSKTTSGTILSGSSLTFTHTPLSLGIRSGDSVIVNGSGVTNLDGEWPVNGANENATSFTLKTEDAVTVSAASPVSGTLVKVNTLVIRNRNVIIGSAEASSSPVTATIKAENAIGTDTAGGDLVLQAGLGTGNATGGDFIVKTGQVETTNDNNHTPTTRLTIDTSGKAAFTGAVDIAGNLSIPDNSKAIFGAGSDLQIYHDGTNSYIQDNGTGQLILQGSTKVILKGVNGDRFLEGNENGAVDLYYNDLSKLATTSTGVSVTGDVATATVTTTGLVSAESLAVTNNSTMTGDLAINGGDLTTTATTFNLINANATTVNFAGAATTVNIGTGGQGGGTTTVGHDLTVTGNLTVNGTTTTVNSTEITVDDPLMTLGGDTPPTSDDNKDRGVAFRWHDGSNAKLGFFGYDDSKSAFTFIPDGSNTSEVITGNPGEILVGSVNLNDHSNTNTAETTNITAAATTVVDSWSATTYRSGKYFLQVTCTAGTDSGDYQSSEILMIHNGVTSTLTNYAVVRTGNNLVTFTTDISGGNVRLLAQATSGNTIKVKLTRTIQTV